VTSQWGCYHGDHILYISIFYQDKLRLPKHIANIYIYRWTLLNKSFQTGSSLNQRDHMGSSSRDRKPRNEKHLGIWSEYLVIPTINTFLKSLIIVDFTSLYLWCVCEVNMTFVCARNTSQCSHRNHHPIYNWLIT
jgi:hypothetical protein